MPTKEHKESKKQLILRAALKLFSHKGFSATTTKEIAKECGVAEGLIFYHFGDKRKLLLHLVNNFSFAIRIEEDKDVLSQLPLEEALVHYGMQYFRFLQQNLDYLMLIWSPEMIQDEQVTQDVLQHIQNMSMVGGATLKEGLSSAGKHRDERSYEVAMMTFTSSIFMYFITRSRFGHNVHVLDEESYIRQLVHMLLHGLIDQDR